MKLPTLNALLGYKNPTVTRYFTHHHPEVNQEAAEQLFQDLLAWLWLNAYRKQQHKQTWFFGPLLLMDAMWHAFILHSREYHAFCQNYFGDYFHHEVETPGFEHELQPDELADYLKDCFEYLGDEWVQRHFAEAFI